VSQATFEDVAGLIHVDVQREVWPKGFEAPQQVHRVAAIHGAYELAIPPDRAQFVELAERMPVRFALLDGKSVSGHFHDGEIASLSSTGARLLTDAEVSDLAELRIEIIGPEGVEGVCYAKVVDRGSGTDAVLTVRFSVRALILTQRADVESLTHSTR
jgi:hypothetical protein